MADFKDLPVHGEYNDEMFNYLFGKNYFQNVYGGKPDKAYLEEIRKASDHFEYDDSDSIETFKKNLTCEDRMYDESQRDYFGNYNKNSEWYQKMKDAGFPFGGDRDPDDYWYNLFYDI